MSLKIAEIEQELREIWKGFSEKEDKEQVVTRAQVMNLIVYSPRRNTDFEITQVLADVSAESPGRMIVLIRDPNLPAAVMNSWVNALCHLASGGRRQVCCEQIIIHAGERDVHQWSSVVLPLLVPDLPVLLWWQDRPESDLALLNTILESCDRLILDSALSGNLKTVNDLFRKHGEWVAISDLNWARLTPWRLAVAGFYDNPECRPCLESLIQIEIDCESPFDDPAQAYLFLGWLASGLGWNWADKPNLQSPSQSRISVDLRCEKGRTEKLLKVRLISADSYFQISLTPDALYLQTEVIVGKKNRGAHVLKLPEQTQSNLLAKEVTILEHDAVYERSVQFLI